MKTAGRKGALTNIQAERARCAKGRWEIYLLTTTLGTALAAGFLVFFLTACFNLYNFIEVYFQSCKLRFGKPCLEEGNASHGGRGEERYLHQENRIVAVIKISL